MDENEKRGKIIKIIILISILLLITIITTIIYIKTTQIKKLKERLENNNYKMEYENFYHKSIEKENIKTNYKFDITNNQFIKSINENSQILNKKIILTYQNNQIKVNYTSLDTNGCSINQKATYNKDFKCEINYINKKECTSKCDEILKEIKNFKKEYKKLTNKR